nr:hypothetical protein [Tanacetum cinerariifolium]
MGVVEYVHRIGRTGRAGATAIGFLLEQQMSFHDNFRVFKRSVAGENVLLSKLAQDGESAALIDLTRHPQCS